MRRWIGHREDDRPIIATGHQTELYHPGVWVKNAAIAAAAERIGASAFHFAVDMDAPKHLVYRWPGGGQPLSDDPAQTRASWSGLVKPPSREHVMRIAEESRAAAETWSIAPCSSVFFDRLSRSGDAVSVSEAITSAHGAADAAPHGAARLPLAQPAPVGFRAVGAGAHLLAARGRHHPGGDGAAVVPVQLSGGARRGRGAGHSAQLCRPHWPAAGKAAGTGRAVGLCAVVDCRGGRSVQGHCGAEQCRHRERAGDRDRPCVAKRRQEGHLAGQCRGPPCAGRHLAGHAGGQDRHPRQVVAEDAAASALRHTSVHRGHGMGPAFRARRLHLKAVHEPHRRLLRAVEDL